MTDDKINPLSLSERIEIVDVLRGLAVCGILIGNMQWFSGYGMMPPVLAEQGPMIDKIIHFLVHFFVEGKFYSIFSFLFGFSFALQIGRAGERGDLKASLFKRRLFWLLIIGLLHAYGLWAGDILSVYAVMGFLLLFFRKKSDPSLLKWAFALMVVPIVTYIILYIIFISFLPPEIAASVDNGQVELWNKALTMVSTGSWATIFRDYNLDYVIGRYLGLIFQMRLPKILAMFLLGFYAYRRGFFQDLSGNKPFIRKVLVYGFVLGFAGNAVFAVFAKNEAPFPPSPAGLAGVVAYSFGVPAMALFIISLVAKLWQNESWKRLLGVFAPVGRMALTSYLSQTIICVIIFYGYGFGKFGSIGATTGTIIALAIFLFQIVLSTLWLKYFRFGPMEWIWRQLTYRRRLDLRITPDPTTAS